MEWFAWLGAEIAERWNLIDWTAPYWTGVSGVAAALTGLVAIWTLAHAARDSRERTRPVMVAEYRVPENADRALEFVVRNAGASVARDIEVSFDPQLEPVQPNQAIRPYLIKRYAKRIANLGPGQELTNIFFADTSDPAKSDLPLQLKVTVTYKRSWFLRYKDTYQLDTEVYAHHTYVTSTNSVLGRLTQIRDELRKVSGTRTGAASRIITQLDEIASALQPANKNGGPPTGDSVEP